MKYLLKIPILPIVFIIVIITLIKIIKETGIVELCIKAESGEEILTKEFKEGFEQRYYYIKPTLNALNIIGWFYIIKYLFF